MIPQAQFSTSEALCSCTTYSALYKLLPIATSGKMQYQPQAGEEACVKLNQSPTGPRMEQTQQSTLSDFWGCLLLPNVPIWSGQSQKKSWQQGMSAQFYSVERRRGIQNQAAGRLFQGIPCWDLGHALLLQVQAVAPGMALPMGMGTIVSEDSTAEVWKDSVCDLPSHRSKYPNMYEKCINTP